MQFSIQLYSLRALSETAADFLALFPRLKALGFDGVEFAGYHGLGAKELRKALDDAGLVATGTHVGLDELRPEKLPATIAFCKTLGMDKIGVGGAPHGTPNETVASCAVLKAAYQAAKPQGITIYYHNHSSEFKPFEDGTLAIDQFFGACALQIDTCWSAVAGVDNYPFLMAHKAQICALHIKDALLDGSARVLGQGEVDLPTVVRAAKGMGLGWLVLEHEGNDASSVFDEVAQCAAWLNKNV
ncbi:MAG: sugar phosphate isomerase/epimerase [Oscillospiraceae bacterium]|jgi:sugar phosphate isomerase/epimerase|nr:sugar phosphate isomerase/epimerase [Oscillospiraceae bacterium]